MKAQPQKPDLESTLILLNTIKEGVEKFGSLDNLTAELQHAVYKKDQRSQEIDVVIDILCDDYAITKRALMSSRRGTLSEAREIAYCILHFELNLTYRFIARTVFGKKEHNHIPVYNAVTKFRTMNEKSKAYMQLKERYNRIWDKCKSRFNNK